MLSKIAQIVQFAYDLDQSGRPDLAEDVDQRLKEIQYMMSLPQQQRQSVASVLSSLDENHTNKGCSSCGGSKSTIKTASFDDWEDWTEDPQMREWNESLGGKDDVESFGKYMDKNPNDPHAGFFSVSPDGIEQRIKTLMLERGAYNEALQELQNNGINSKDDEHLYDNLNREINSLDQQIVKEKKQWKQLKHPSNLN